MHKNKRIKRKVNMYKNVLEYLEKSASEFPQKTAVADENSEYTYEELLKKSKNAGAVLSTVVQPCSPIPVYMEKSCKTLAIFMGAVQAGCFYCLLDTSMPAERTNMILSTLEAKVMIVDEKSAKKQEKLGFTGKVLYAEELLAHEITAQEEEKLLSVRENALDIDPLYSIFTSGSTGVPKGVIVNHRSVIDFIEYFTDIFHITGDDVIGNQAPFDFDVSVKDIYSSLKTGATLQIIPKKLFSFPMPLMDYLDDRKVTTLIWAVSALCIVTTLKGFEYKRPSCINKVIFSGEVMPIKHLNAWREAYPTAMFVNVYGPTEITCNCTYYIVDREFALDAVLPMGKAFPNERVFLLDDDDAMITPDMTGKAGEICVSGTAVTLGYYNNAERTSQAFVQNPLNHAFNEIIYRTGDLGYYNDRQEMCFSSRKDFQIKHMGHRIELGEIDMAMNSVDTVVRACCIFDKDENKILGFYEGEADKKTITHELTKKLPKFMIPQEFIQVKNMPITKNGKIDRNALMEGRKNA
jgi:amino acid adenylation domain-containing protein